MSEKSEVKSENKRTCSECGCSHFDPCIHCVEVPGESKRHSEIKEGV